MAHLLGFSPLPWEFFFLLAGMVVVYLAFVELAKMQFYRATERRPTRNPPAAALGRRERQTRRVAAHFRHVRAP